MRRSVAGLSAVLVLGMGCNALKGIVKVNGSTPSIGSSGGGDSESPSRPAVASGGSSHDDDSGPGWELKADRVYVVKPDPGKAKVPAMSPTWCDSKDDVAGSHDAILIKGYLAFDEQRREWPLSDWPKAAAILCQAPDQETVKQQTGYLVQLYVNRYDLTVPEAVRAVTVDVTQSRYDDEQKKLCDAMGADEQEGGLYATAENKALADLYGCSGTAFGTSWPLWREPVPKSALVRLARVSSCLHGDFEPERVGGLVGVQTSWAMISYLTCAPLFDQLDRKAVIAELDKRKAPEWAKINAIEALGTARRHLAVADKWYAETVAKQKDWKVLRAAAEKRFGEWKAEYTANQATFEAAWAVDEALASDSKSTRKGCNAEPLVAAVYKQLGGAKPGNLEAFQAAANKPVVNIAANRAAACLEAQGKGTEALVLAQIAGAGQTNHGGTDSELMYAMFLALQGLRADRDSALEGVDLKVSVDGRGVYISSWKDDHPARVARATAKGDEVELSFTPELIDDEECTSSRETRKIDRIDSDGKIRYREECLAWKKVKVNIAPEPVRIPKRFATGVTPGVYVHVLRLGDHGAPTGIAYAVSADKGGKKPSVILGLDLK